MSSYIVEPATQPLMGVARIPGDKSIGHRSLLFGALADGAVTIHGLSQGMDNQRTREAIRCLGVRSEDLPTGQVVVHGVGLRGLQPSSVPIDCGNSGTTMRLLAGVLAAQRFDSMLVGDLSLSARPMRRIVDPLMMMGARASGESGPRSGELYPPLQITGIGDSTLKGIQYQQPVASAQVKSAILLAGLFADGCTEITEPGASRSHTESMLARMGAPITVDGNVIRLDPSGWDGRLAAGLIKVPGDPSSAAFLVAAALVAGVERVSVQDVCVDRRRTGFLEVLANFGARVELEARSESEVGAVADLALSRGAADDLQGSVIAGDLIVRSLDELPILAVVAARAQGLTEFRDAHELRHKESDRIATTCRMLRALEVTVEEFDDGFSVQGKAGAPFAACEIDAFGDHRIAMSAVIAGLCADGPVKVNHVDNVMTSFPGFVAVLNGIGARVSSHAH